MKLRWSTNFYYYSRNFLSNILTYLEKKIKVFFLFDIKKYRKISNCILGEQNKNNFILFKIYLVNFDVSLQYLSNKFFIDFDDIFKSLFTGLK